MTSPLDSHASLGELEGGKKCYPSSTSNPNPSVQGREPEYLDYNIKGRSWWERMPYNAGSMYLTGEG